MTKEQQDLAWACLPKEVRTELIAIFNMPSKYGYSDSVRNLLIGIYGGNLTSNTEPEEMLMVSKSKVIGLIKYLYSHPAHIAAHKADERASELRSLFGDKCLTDKEPSVQVEPKKFFESDYGIGNKVVVCISSIGEPRKEVVTLIRQYQPQCENNDYAKTWVIQTQDGQTFQSNEEHFEPYTEPIAQNPAENSNTGSLSSKSKSMEEGEEEEDAKKIVDNTISIAKEYFDNVKIDKDNMEEKEQNLCELLKGCEEEEFYCSYLRNNVKFIGFDEHDGMTFILSLYKDGLGYENLMYIKKNENIGKSFVLYPSKELYKKYPLDPVKAWSIWVSERKPKFNVKVIIECWQDNDDNPQTKTFGATYSSKEEAQQAAEAVRECLMKFHELNQK